MAKRSLRLISKDEFREADFATVRFVPPEDPGFGPNLNTASSYEHLQSYIDDLRISSNANGRILLPHDTENALLRFLDMNAWLTSLEATLHEARVWQKNARMSLEQKDRFATLMGISEQDDAYTDDLMDKNDADNRVQTLEELLYTGCECAWEALLEAKRRKIDENWNYRVRARTLTLCNDSILIGSNEDDPAVHDHDLVALEPLLQDHAWLFFMRCIWANRPIRFGPLGNAVEDDFVKFCYELGESDLLVTDSAYDEYTMQEAVTAYSLFLRATYAYPHSKEMMMYERSISISLARILAEASPNPQKDYNMIPFVSNHATTHLREESSAPSSFGIKTSFFRFTDVLVFPTKMRLQTASMLQVRCIEYADSLSYPSPKTERGYKYWRSVAFRLVRLNHVVAQLEDSFFRNDFCNFPIEHIYQSGLMENELLRFSLERPGQEPEAASILETLREKDYIDLNVMAKEMPHYFCANYTHSYLMWMKERLGVDVSEFLNEVTAEETVPNFTSGVPLSGAATCPELEKACWPPSIPDISILDKVPSQVERGITEEEAERVRKIIEYRAQSPFDAVAFFCYMYILNAWGRQASRQHYIYPDYVVTDLLYRSDQIQEILRKMEAMNTANTLPYLIYVCQKCYIFHRGKYEFVPNFSEAIERYIARFVRDGHVYEEAANETLEDGHAADDDFLSAQDPYLLRHHSLLYHTDPQRKNEPTYGLAPRLRWAMSVRRPPSRVRIRSAKNRKRVLGATQSVNVRIRELKEGRTSGVESDNRLSIDITESVQELYDFGNSVAGHQKSRRSVVDGTYRRLLSILESATAKTGPSFEAPKGLGTTFQAVFLQDTEIQRAVSEILVEISRQTRLYQFCAIYVPIDMEDWLRTNLNNPKKTNDALPFVVVNPHEGRYIVERDEGEVNYTIYFIPDDEKVLDTHMIAIYECNPHFSSQQTHGGHSTSRDITSRSTAASNDQIALWSPYWEFLQRRNEFFEAQENERLADKHRSTYVDYIIPPVPKELDMGEMTEGQLFARAGMAVNNINPNMQANEPGVFGTNASELTYDQYVGKVYQIGMSAGYNNAAVPVNTNQNPNDYKRESRIQRLRPGETVNRNPHAVLLRNSFELKKRYEMDLCAEMKVPYSYYRMSEKGSYHKDDNRAEAEMFAGAIMGLQKEMVSIFYFLYQHTLGILDDELLSAYRKWERNIAFSSEDVELLKKISIGSGDIEESDLMLIGDKSGPDLSRAAFLVSEISQLTPFDVAMFSYMNSIDVPEEDQRYLVTINFLPPPEVGTTNLKDYIDVYNAGILQEEMIQAIRSRLNLPEPEDENGVVGDPNPRPSKRLRAGSNADDDQDQ